MRDGLVGPGLSVFDYGCGHGQDVVYLTAQGISCHGWDPNFFPDEPRHPSDVVNLGYVINVIDDPQERASTIRQAWQLCRRFPVVAAQVRVPGRGQAQVEFGDGVLTSRGTFQKYFEQSELRSFIETELGREAIPADLGVFYVFKDEAAGQQFLANRQRRRVATPRKRVSEVQFEAHKDLLEPFMAAIASIGRLPEADEYPAAALLLAQFGSFKRAFALIRRITGAAEWEAIT
jgi:DNA phosphorothioation-associated putative methyltransferase